MNLYLISQDYNTGYDTYDSAIVAAESEQEARETHPSQFVTHIKDNKWMGTYSKGGEYDQNGGHDWLRFEDIDKVSVELIGVAKDGTEKGVILSSFNAG